MESNISIKELENLKIGDRIIAIMPNWSSDDKDHIQRPFIVVGNDVNNKKVYGLYTTSSKKAEKYDQLYYKMRYSNYKDGANYHVQVNKLIEIDYDNVINKAYSITHENEMLEIRNRLSTYVIDTDKVDYTTLVNVRCPGCIFIDDEDLCLVTKIEKGVAYYYKFIPSNNGGIMLNYKMYKLNFDKLYQKPSKNVKKRVKNITRKEFFRLISKKYDFGDVVNYNNSKIIVVAINNENVYYCDYDSLDMFLGLKKAPMMSVNGDVIETLSNLDKKKLATKINNYLKRTKFMDDMTSNTVKKQVEGLI